ncbi:periplasmic heavy metal sensor [Allorhizobium pseudoryzae]|uniref:periplasmic heavy metal sensor n=1 Tax=Allorhizobium pseudoryzae TaxID=379684 RepID=UPI003CFF080D
MTDQSFRRLVLGLLVVNTFLLAAVIGGGAFYLSGETRQTAQRLPLAGEQLPATQRKALQQALTEARRAVRSTQLEARQARVEAAALMGKPDFDAAALSDALARARTAEMAVRAAVEARAVAFAATLSTDERRRLADGLIGREAPRPATK